MEAVVPPDNTNIVPMQTTHSSPHPERYPRYSLLRRPTTHQTVLNTTDGMRRRVSSKRPRDDRIHKVLLLPSHPVGASGGAPQDLPDGSDYAHASSHVLQLHRRRSRSAVLTSGVRRRHVRGHHAVRHHGLHTQLHRDVESKRGGGRGSNLTPDVLGREKRHLHAGRGRYPARRPLGESSRHLLEMSPLQHERRAVFYAASRRHSEHGQIREGFWID